MLNHATNSSQLLGYSTPDRNFSIPFHEFTLTVADWTPRLGETNHGDSSQRDNQAEIINKIVDYHKNQNVVVLFEGEGSHYTLKFQDVKSLVSEKYLYSPRLFFGFWDSISARNELAKRMKVLVKKSRKLDRINTEMARKYKNKQLKFDKKIDMVYETLTDLLPQASSTFYTYLRMGPYKASHRNRNMIKTIKKLRRADEDLVIVVIAGDAHLTSKKFQDNMVRKAVKKADPNYAYFRIRAHQSIMKMSKDEQSEQAYDYFEDGEGLDHDNGEIDGSANALFRILVEAKFYLETDDLKGLSEMNPEKGEDEEFGELLQKRRHKEAVKVLNKHLICVKEQRKIKRQVELYESLWESEPEELTELRKHLRSENKDISLSEQEI